MARSFSEKEKENIRKRMTEVCRQSWTRYGYKKTSVDEICRGAGISKGAFYLFFESKEALFCEVLCSVQREISAMAAAVMDEAGDKTGVAEALKRIYRAYEENAFLYDSDQGDYAVLMNKVSAEQAEELAETSEQSRRIFLNRPYLQLKTEEDTVISVIYSLIMNIRNKDILPCNHREVFDFMADHLIDDLYE